MPGSFNSRVSFTATESGTYYIAAGAFGSSRGTYEMEVTDTSPPIAPPVSERQQSTQQNLVDADAAREGATDLGDITDLDGPRFPRASLDGDGDRIDYYRFTLTEAKQIGLGLRQQDTNADLFLEDADGNVLHSSTVDGTANEAINETLLAGTYYVRVETEAAGQNDHVFRYGVSAPDPDEVARLEQPQGGTNAAPAFGQQSYAFDVAENADGSTTGVALGTVSATDADSDTVTYSIESGNAAELFEIDGSTGALSYKGTGEDYESETTSYDLTVRANDGSLHSEVIVIEDGQARSEASLDHRRHDCRQFSDSSWRDERPLAGPDAGAQAANACGGGPGQPNGARRLGTHDTQGDLPRFRAGCCLRWWQPRGMTSGCEQVGGRVRAHGQSRRDRGNQSWSTALSSPE